MASVIYYSMTGNTKKMASAVAEELGVKALSVKETGLPEDGTLFIGSGCYGDKPGEDMAKFIAANDFTGRKVALFGTSGAGAGKEVSAMAEALKNKGASILGSYHSKGRAFLVVNIGHPDRDEMEGARQFAREMTRIG
ncbi:MAG TPA: flavodoxin family protein [Methanocella sp.]|uniref:flavodoxin family protein n=1 Tax=Methanocella sp. TaxID=2052833 RepID=UPI002B7A6230|nr:flavodoxin family protein [Methanocella sp.]HTY90130.1 flavodoxin family protein [Methanocella sp.]